MIFDTRERAERIPYNQMHSIGHNLSYWDMKYSI